MNYRLISYSGRRVPDSHITVRPHSSCLTIRFIISVFIRNKLLIVAKLLFLHLQTCLQKFTLQI